MSRFPNRAQAAVFGVLAFALVVLMALALSDMAVRTARRTAQDTWEAEMEQIAVAATNDLLLNPDGGMLRKGGPAELNDHVLDMGRVKSFDNRPSALKELWKTGDCGAALGVYLLDGEQILEAEKIRAGRYGRFVFRRLAVIEDEVGRKEEGYLELEVSC